MTSSETALNDEELITYLRFQGLDKDIAAADRIEELSAKLAKAMGALRLVVTAKGLTDPIEHGYETIVFARAVLSELRKDT